MALAPRFDNPRTQLAVCQWVRRVWVLLTVANVAGAVHESVNGQWMVVLHLAVLVLIACACKWGLGPMLADARHAHVANLERELGMR